MVVVGRELLNRIQMEYIEMPGLALTSRQAGRLWNLEPSLCEHLLAILVEQRFLARSKEGMYLRRSAGRCGVTGKPSQQELTST